MLISTDQEKIEIINCLRELDCCPRCILRYIGAKGAGAFEEPETYLKVICEDIKPIFLYQKKIKRNPCRICLDIFNDLKIGKFVESIPSKTNENYKYTDYTLNVSFPKAILIRNRSMFIYLKEKFPHIYDNMSNNIEGMNKVFLESCTAIISNKINKFFHVSSKFSLLFEIGYEDDEVEVQNINKFDYNVGRNKNQDISRNVILAVMEKCEDDLFKKHFPVPPEIPNKDTFLINIQIISEPLWLGGRYLKFSREMGQTPWLVIGDNKVGIEHNVQDILYDGIINILGGTREQLTFSSSGREDIDVRMLGNGRPFYVAINNPADRSVTFEQLRAIEREILKSKLGAVIKLKVVPKSSLKIIKDGEEHKRKHYNALCKAQADNVDGIIKLINNYMLPLEIGQKTPIRVLHRRTQAVRKKYIYSMEAKAVPGHSDLFDLKVVTQAGTYVKEFIHSDLGRTTPSVTSIVRQQIDLVALDVTRVELEWPEGDNIKSD